MQFGAEAALTAAQGFDFGLACFGPSRVLMRPDDRAIDVMLLPIYLPSSLTLLLEGLQQPLPNPGFLPAVKAAGHRRPGAIAFGDVTPRGARMQAPEDTIEDASVIFQWPAAAAMMR